MSTDFLYPSLGLLVKLGSAVVHAEEMLSCMEPPALGSPASYDRVAIETLLADPEVRAWVSEGTSRALLPLRRSAAPQPARRRTP